MQRGWLCLLLLGAVLSAPAGHGETHMGDTATSIQNIEYLRRLYAKATCWVSSRCQLNANTTRLLEKHFSRLETT